MRPEQEDKKRREEARHHAEVELHFANGGKVECRVDRTDWGVDWRTVTSPAWNWDKYEYRIVKQEGTNPDFAECMRRMHVENAYKTGAKIEMKGTDNLWRDVIGPCFFWNTYDYRVKEESPSMLPPLFVPTPKKPEPKPTVRQVLKEKLPKWIWQRVRINCRNVRATVRLEDEFILHDRVGFRKCNFGALFLWDSTEEGHEFWGEVDDYLCGRSKELPTQADLPRKAHDDAVGCVKYAFWGRGSVHSKAKSSKELREAKADMLVGIIDNALAALKALVEVIKGES